MWRTNTKKHEAQLLPTIIIKVKLHLAAVRPQRLSRRIVTSTLISEVLLLSLLLILRNSFI